MESRVKVGKKIKFVYIVGIIVLIGGWFFFYGMVIDDIIFLFGMLFYIF